MKLVLFLALVVGGSSVTAQPKLVSQVTINTTTNVIAPEEEDITSIQTQGQGGEILVTERLNQLPR